MRTEPALGTLREADAGLMLAWARLLAPHYGLSGAMELDLRDWPGAQGPSYYNQFAHYPFLLLAEGIVPGAADDERARFRELALRNLEYTVGLADAEFHTPHYSRGRDWGRHVGEWLCYYQLCSLELLERGQIGPPELRRRLREVVAGATGHLHRLFLEKYAVTPAEFVGNHDTWHALLFYRAGRWFGREDWTDYGRDFMQRCVLPFQHADGYWPEAGGIVVGYSLVTALAVSAYAELSGDAAAQAAVGRALAFAESFALPDGSSAVAVDVRMRYHPHPLSWLPGGFIRQPAGRRLVRETVDPLLRHLQAHGVRDNNAQAFAFHATFAETLFGSDAERPVPASPPPRSLPVARLERDGWMALLGWQLVPEWASNRFVLDSQNFVEVWRAGAGYLAGTGNSKAMPRFSTVRRTTHGRSYVPDRAEGRRCGPHGAVASYGYGEDEIEVRLALTDGGCEIGARVLRNASGATYEFALLLALKPGDAVRTAAGETKVEPRQLLQATGSFRWREQEWELPAGATLEYPLVPHNSYTQDGLPARDDYVGRISFLLGTEVKRITIR